VLVQQYHRIGAPDTPHWRHLKLDTLKVALFHGDNRAKTTEALVDHDVVLTTYRTLVFDWKGRRVLQAMEWFRVVLDEGKLSSSLTANRKCHCYLQNASKMAGY
jgi:SNF2 family DNA or RNA helicase